MPIYIILSLADFLTNLKRDVFICQDIKHNINNINERLAFDREFVTNAGIPADTDIPHETASVFIGVFTLHRQLANSG